MKKRLLIFLIIVSFLIIYINKKSVNTNASDIIDDSTNLLIAEVGAGSDADLLRGNASDVSLNINWDKEGLYTVSELIGDNYYNRDVIVISKEDLLNGFIYSKKKNTIDASDNILSYDVLFINDSDYYIYVNTSYNSETIIMYYENNVLKSKNTISNYYIQDAIIYNKNLYAIVNANNKISSIIINKNSQIVREMTYSSNKEDYPVSIESFNNEIYLVFNSNSNTGFIERSTSYLVGALMKINNMSLEKESIKIISNNNESRILSSCSNEDNILLEMIFTGTSGSYKNTLNGGYTGKMIIEYNKSKTLVKASISDANINKRLEYNDYCYYLIKEDFNNKLIEVYFNDYLSELNFSYYISDSDLKLSYLLNEYSLYVFINDNNNLKEFVSFSALGVKEYKTYLGYIPVDKAIISYNNIYLLLADGTIFLNELELYEASFEEKQTSSSSMLLAKLKRNNKDVDLNYNKLDNKKMYGSYDMSVYAYSTCSSFVFASTIDVELDINITNNVTYDLGLILDFNGIAYLNNEKIESGYIINDIGKYDLEIIGENKPKVIFSFTVSSLSSNYKEDDNNKLINETDRMDFYYQDYKYNKDIISNDIEYEVTKNKEDNNDYVFYIVIISSLIIITFSIIIKNYLNKRGIEK